MQEQDFRNLFYKKSAFMKYERDLNFLEDKDEQDIVTNTGSRPLPIIFKVMII